MQRIVFEHFRDVVFARWPPPGPRVLEIGASSPETALLMALDTGKLDAVGIDLAPSGDLSLLPFPVLAMNANDMSRFEDQSFDAVICIGVFNNDRHFWRSLAEVNRVLRPGGLFYLHVPGFDGGLRKLAVKRRLYRLGQRMGWYWPIRLAENTWLSAVPAYHFSPTPADYWRFSGVAVEEVLLEGFDVLHLQRMLYPPRWVAAGRKR